MRLPILTLFALVLATSCTKREAATAQASNGTLATPNATAAPAVDTITDRADQGRIAGNAAAPAWFIEVSDFQCPYCKRFHDEVFGSIQRDYVKTGKLRVAYLNLPLNIHQHSVPAAEAAMCASVQGKFWEMHDKLFETQQKWEGLPSAAQYFDSLAATTGVGMPAWRQCVSKHLTAALVEADRERIKTKGVKSTPTFFIGNKVIEGTGPYAAFRDTIEAVLTATRKGGSKPGVQ